MLLTDSSPKHVPGKLTPLAMAGGNLSAENFRRRKGDPCRDLHPNGPWWAQTLFTDLRWEMSRLRWAFTCPCIYIHFSSYHGRACCMWYLIFWYFQHLLTPHRNSRTPNNSSSSWQTANLEFAAVLGSLTAVHQHHAAPLFTLAAEVGGGYHQAGSVCHRQGNNEMIVHATAAAHCTLPSCAVRALIRHPAV